MEVLHFSEKTLKEHLLYKSSKILARIEVNLNDELCKAYPDNHEQKFLEMQNKV